MAKELLEAIEGAGKVYAYAGNVTNSEDIKGLIDYSVEQCGQIDIWINNAGVNQPMKPMWDLSEDEIDYILDVDLKGTIIGSRLVMLHMIKQGFGAIYNMEGSMEVYDSWV